MSAVAKERILLVDDEPQVLIALEDLLQDDFAVVKSESPDRALNLLQNEPDIAVVVTDQRMPRMTGDELLTRIGPRCEAQRILVTGFADLAAVIRAVNEGKIFAYVTKPWNEEDLRLKVQKAAMQFRLARELERERKLLRDLMDNVPDGVYFKNRELRFQRTNRAFAEILSSDISGSDIPDKNVPDRLVGKLLADVARSPEYVKAAIEEDNEILERGVSVADVVREYEKLWLSETKAPIRDTNGDILGIVGIVRDVTERIGAEEALRVSEERLREQTRILNSILQSMGEGVVVADRTGMIVHCNQQAQSILGSVPSAEGRRHWAEACGLEDMDTGLPLLPDHDPLMRAVAGESTTEMELMVRNDVVPETRLAVTARPVNDVEGERLGGVLVLRNVTQERQLEEQLRQSQKMEAVGQLAGGIAHDFNNLLAVIMSYSQLVLDALPTSDDKHDDVNEILDASKRAAALTGQLLAFSRRRMVRPEVLDLNEIVKNMEKMLGRIIGEAIHFPTKLEAELLPVRADRGQLEQVLLNLIVNARDAMPDGGTLTIQTKNEKLDRALGAVPAGRCVLLSVSDTGTGMDQETQRRIFEPFFTTKGVGKGTGLGLSTVYGIVQQSGGHILIDSEPGAGSCFRIYLPSASEALEKDSKKAGASLPPTRLGTILLIEDDVAVRRVTARILRRAGHNVLVATDAAEARAFVQERGNEIELLLTDLVMPDVSGPELAEEFVNILPELRVVYMSGYASGSISSDEFLAVGRQLVEKPFAPKTLLNEIERALEQRSSASAKTGG